MENEAKANKAPVSEGKAAAMRQSDATAGVPERCLKPLLTVEQQIAHMKSKGITFDLCSEEEAAAYLADRTYFFKLYAYRVLFERRVGGLRDGQYVGLDFGYLEAPCLARPHPALCSAAHDARRGALRPNQARPRGRRAPRRGRLLDRLRLPRVPQPRRPPQAHGRD